MKTKNNPYGFNEEQDENDTIDGICPHCSTWVDPWNVYRFFGYRCYVCTPKWYIRLYRFLAKYSIVSRGWMWNYKN